jgi:hypothetical protein
VLALVALLDLELEQLDVKIAFLHEDLDEEIYMEQPEGFVQNRSKKFVSDSRNHCMVSGNRPDSSTRNLTLSW